MPSIPDVIRHLHTLHDITRKSKFTVEFGDLGPVKRNTAVKQLKDILLGVAGAEGWVDVLTAIASGDKKWESDFSDHLIDTASGHYEGEGGATVVDLNVKLWVDIDCPSTQDEHRMVLEDTNSGRISKTTWGTYQAVTSKNDMAAAKFEMGLCRLVYDKENHDPAWDVEVEDSAGGSRYTVRHFNIYAPPPWARIPLDGVDLSKPPAIVQEFLELLVSPDLRQIEWMYSWAHYAQTSRSPVCPIFSGAKGTGKSILNHVLAALFAVSRPAPRNFFDTRFNAPFLKGNEYCPIDEFPGDLLAIRKYMNKFQMVESKGKDSSFTEICTNFSITTNPENVLKVQPDERIFAVMDPTDIDLRQSWPEEKIAAFVKIFDPDSMDPIKAHWFHFIKNYTPQYKPTHIWKGKRFSELVIEGLADWQAFLREECLRTLERTGPGGELLVSKLRKDYRSKRNLGGNGGSLFPKDKTAQFLLKMAQTGDVLGTLLAEPKQHILVGINPLDDFGAL